MLTMGVPFGEPRSQRTSRIAAGHLDLDGADERVTTTEPWPVLEVPSARWAVAVAVPSCGYDLKPGRRVWLEDPVTGSWASVVPLGDKEFLVRQAGARRLWDEAEAAYRWWRQRGEPFITTWQWTITPDRQSIRLPG
jgi:hypothetical protein